MANLQVLMHDVVIPNWSYNRDQQSEATYAIYADKLTLPILGRCQIHEADLHDGDSLPCGDVFLQLREQMTVADHLEHSLK